jgi:putative hydrolase of the HAD superfamily
MSRCLARRLPAAILFDLDDTLLSAYGKRELAWAKVAAEFAADLAPLEPDAFVAGVCACSDRFWDDPARHKEWRSRLQDARRRIVAGALAELVARDAPPRAALTEAIADRFTALRDEEMCLFPGAHDVLDRLKAFRVRLGLVTNGAAAIQRAKLVRFSLEHRFDHIQIEGEHGFGKPEERAYSHAMQALGVGPLETWMVGDNLEWEVAAPQRLGIHAIWYDAYDAGLPPGSPVRPDRIIKALPELLEASP